MTKENLESHNYRIKDHCIYTCSTGKDGSHEQRLCNFSMQVLSEITIDDGIQPTSSIRIGGTHQDGRTLPEVELPTSEALTLGWINNLWGVDCILELGNTVKDKLRYALQMTANGVEKKTVYAVTGWKKIHGQWVFLMPGDETISVRLPEKMHGYGMERHFDITDMRVAAHFFQQPPAPTEVIYPLLAFTFLSPLNHFLKLAGYEPKFVLLLQGKTGCRKSTLAALMLSFFGKFTASSLPMSFRDTANYTMSNAFALKDVLTCIDDFHPTGRKEEQKLVDTAQTIMRAYGDRTSRGRLRQDCTAMASRPPQGNAIITAEMAPDIGESGTARYFSLELQEKDVDLQTLSAFQSEAQKGTLQKSMFAYTEWLRETYLKDQESEELFVLTLRKRFEKYRENFRSSDLQCHGRVPEMAAWLQIGMEMFLSFLVENACLNADSRKEIEEQFQEILYGLAIRQAKNIILDKPTHIFIRKLYALLESGSTTVLQKNANPDWVPPNCIGYEDSVYLYLHMDKAYTAVRNLCQSEGESMSLPCRPMVKALVEEKIVEPGANQSTKAVRIGDRTIRLLCLYKDKAEAIANNE